MSEPKGPFRLVTVNTAPERAKRLIGRLVEALKDNYTIIHVKNCESAFDCSHVLRSLLTTERSHRRRPTCGEGVAARRFGKLALALIGQRKDQTRA